MAELKATAAEAIHAAGEAEAYTLEAAVERLMGVEALLDNIAAVKVVADSVAMTLGPRGKEKTYSLPDGRLVITSDGAAVVSYLQPKHPAAKLVMDVAHAQDVVAGDGTASAVVIANELLAQAKPLVEADIHPTTIINGYRMAADKAIEILRTKAIDIQGDDRELATIAGIPIGCRITRVAQRELSELAVAACRAVQEDDETTATGKTVNLALINTLKEKGGTLKDSKLIKGVVIRKPVLHPAMPKKIENAKIALLNTDLTAKTRAIGVEVVPTEAKEVELLREKNKKIMEEMVDTIAQSGANVVVSQTKINPSAFQRLAKNKILCIDEVRKEDMDRLLNAVGGRIVTVLETLEPQDLGEAGLVEEVRTGLTKYIEFTECPNPKSVTIMLRGASEYILDEAERIMIDCTSVIRDVIEDGAIVYGAGGVEVEIAKELRKWAQTIKGTEQMAVMGFALALEEIPRQLAINAGFSASATLAELRDKHQAGRQYTWWGVDVNEGGIFDAKRAEIMEPLRVKEQMIKGATDLAELLLSVDDVIVTRAGLVGRMESEAAAGRFAIAE